ncbi:unnamed protein product [Durusdinium trenchii]|uniref:Uncharacterized protein n=1 Tax=Durusdinium trenchii TaxID=1381693 RepID=A0ABP0PAF0_9DINO
MTLSLPGNSSINLVGGLQIHLGQQQEHGFDELMFHVNALNAAAPAELECEFVTVCVPKNKNTSAGPEPAVYGSAGVSTPRETAKLLIQRWIRDVRHSQKCMILVGEYDGRACLLQRSGESRPFAMEATETMERSLRPSNLNASISATSRQWTHPWPSMTGGGMASPTLTASRFVAPPRVTYVQTQSDLQRPVSMLLPASAPASAPAAPPAKRATAPATLTAPALAAPMMPRASMPAARYGTSYPATAWTMPSVRTMPAHAAPGHACRAYGLAPASQVAMQAQARFPLPV